MELVAKVYDSRVPFLPYTLDIEGYLPTLGSRKVGCNSSKINKYRSHLNFVMFCIPEVTKQTQNKILTAESKARETE